MSGRHSDLPASRSGGMLKAGSTTFAGVIFGALATFVLTRRPYPPGAVVPGGVDEPGWGGPGA